MFGLLRYQTSSVNIVQVHPPRESGHLLPTRCLLLQGFPNKKKLATNSQHFVFFVDFFIAVGSVKTR